MRGRNGASQRWLLRAMIVSKRNYSAVRAASEPHVQRMSPRRHSHCVPKRPELCSKGQQSFDSTCVKSALVVVFDLTRKPTRFHLLLQSEDSQVDFYRHMPYPFRETYLFHGHASVLANRHRGS